MRIRPVHATREVRPFRRQALASLSRTMTAALVLGAVTSATLPGMANAADPIKIGLITALSGQSAQAGEALSRGAQLAITFTGGRPMRTPADTTAFNAKRYAWVKKRIERTDVVAGGTPACTIVYSLGTLYGAWPDGTPFEGNRYVDRFEVSHGLIVKQDVWNDSAERIMIRAGLTG